MFVSYITGLGTNNRVMLHDSDPKSLEAMNLGVVWNRNSYLQERIHWTHTKWDSPWFFLFSIFTYRIYYGNHENNDLYFCSFCVTIRVPHLGCPPHPGWGTFFSFTKRTLGEWLISWARQKNLPQSPQRTRRFSFVFLCGLCDLRGERIFSTSF